MGFRFYSENLIGNAANSVSLYTFSAGSWYYVTEAASEINHIYDRDEHDPFLYSTESFFTIERILVSLPGAPLANMVALQNMNFKNFRIFINSTVVAPVDGHPATMEWTTNTDANMIVHFATVTVASVEVQVASTTTGSAERSLGQLILAEGRYELPRNPNFSAYKPLIKGMRMEKQAADGGTITYSLGRNFEAEVGLKFAPPSVTSELFDMYRTVGSWYFVPFGTITAWDGDAWQVNFTGNYDFKTMAYNDRSSPYYNGVIRLKEIPK